jgi:hypothetical protein
MIISFFRGCLVSCLTDSTVSLKDQGGYNTATDADVILPLLLSLPHLVGMMSHILAMPTSLFHRYGKTKW